MCFCKGHIDRPEQYIEGLQVYLHKLLSLILLFVTPKEHVAIKLNDWAGPLSIKRSRR